MIEDYVYGMPFSFYAITDGYKALAVGSSLNYKHALEGNGGQLTSGAGACTPNYKLTSEQEYFIMDNVIYPTLEYLDAQGNPYLGIMGIDGIMTEDGTLQILGWKSFMQDADAASVLDIIDEDLFDLFNSCIIGTFSDEVSSINMKDKYSVSLVLSCNKKENKENSVQGLDNLDENTIVSFYPAVTKNRYLEFEANTGSVMVLTASASSAGRASDKVYAEAEEIDFEGKSYRKDICRVP